MSTWWSVFAWGGRCDPRIFYLSPNGPAPGCVGADACNTTCRSGSCDRSCSSFPHDIFPRGPLFYPSNSKFVGYPDEPMSEDFTISLVTVVFLLVTMLSMGLFAMHCVRRWSFELFWVAHWIAFPALFCTVLLHAASAWYYVIGGLILWAVDHVLRIRKSLVEVSVGFSCCHLRLLSSFYFAFFGRGSALVADISLSRRFLLHAGSCGGVGSTCSPHGAGDQYSSSDAGS
jgi:hypothetical protein